MTRFLLAVVALGIIALSCVVGYRISESTMAVIVGVVLGMAASIPCGLALLMLMRQPATAQHVEYHYHDNRQVQLIAGGEIWASDTTPPLTPGYASAPGAPRRLPQSSSYRS